MPNNAAVGCIERIHIVRFCDGNNHRLAARAALDIERLRIDIALDGAVKRRVAPLKLELRALLETNATKHARNRYTKTIAGNLLKLWPALWTFTEIDGVEPTNNHAERGLRGAVIYRKLSLGSQSNQGEHTIERLLSASITCRLQKRSLFAYLTELLTNRARGDPLPALI